MKASSKLPLVWNSTQISLVLDGSRSCRWVTSVGYLLKHALNKSAAYLHSIRSLLRSSNKTCRFFWSHYALSSPTINTPLRSPLLGGRRPRKDSKPRSVPLIHLWSLHSYGSSLPLIIGSLLWAHNYATGIHKRIPSALSVAVPPLAHFQHRK